MLHGSRLFTIRKIPVYAHWSAWLIVVLVATNLGQQAGIVIALSGAFGFIVSILIHEFAHAFTARRYGVQTRRITLWGLGGMAQLAGESPTPRAEGWIAAAGPLTSLALAVIGIGGAFGLLGLGVRGDTFSVILWLGSINAILAVLNALPGAPLDGGRVLAAWRWSRHGDRYRARDEAGQAGQIIGWAMVGIGIWLMWRGINLFFLVLTGLFIAMNAMAERKAAVAARRIDGLRVGDLTWYGVAQAPADTDAETMLWQRARLGGAGIVAVTDEQGQLSGVVIEERMQRVPVQMRPITRLRHLMVPFNVLAQAEEQEPLISALTRVHPLAPVITVWRDGRLVGVLPTEQIRQRLAPPPTRSI
jgi:Zn-dependent protease